MDVRTEYSLQQILEHRCTFRRPTIVVFFNLMAAYDSAGRQVLCQYLSLKGIPKEHINLVQALYSNTIGRIKSYGESITSSGGRWGCPPSPYLFNFVIDVLLEIRLPSSNFSGVDLLPVDSLGIRI